MDKEYTKQKLVAMAILIGIMMLKPFVDLANHYAIGTPPLFIYLFAIWIFAIVATAFIVHGKKTGTGDE